MSLNRRHPSWNHLLSESCTCRPPQGRYKSRGSEAGSTHSPLYWKAEDRKRSGGCTYRGHRDCRTRRKARLEKHIVRGMIDSAFPQHLRISSSDGNVSTTFLQATKRRSQEEHCVKAMIILIGRLVCSNTLTTMVMMLMLNSQTNRA